MSAPTRSAAGRSKGRPRWVEEQSRFVYRVGYALTGLLFRFWSGGFRSCGSENVPSEGGTFLIANHTSAMDPFILGYGVPHRMLRGPGKVELFQNRLVSPIMRKLGIFPLRQDVADAGAVRTMLALYRRGDVVVVYPEGGRSPSGEMRAFNPDFTRLVLRLGAPLVPAAIFGGRELLPMGARIPRRHSPVAVVYGPEFRFPKADGREVSLDLVRECTETMERNVAGLLQQARSERSAMLADH